MKNILYLFSLLLLCIACSDSDGEMPVGPARPTMNVRDSLAMVAFYHSMKCAEWKGGFHWDLKDYETWGGVTAVLDKEKNEYHITEIEVPMAETYLPDGYRLPAELGKLSELRSLIVWGDGRAVGGIPPELFNCPLEVLYIVGKANGETRKGFVGIIPKEIGKVTGTLKHLTIANTNIGGEIPEEIGALQQLETSIYLYGNEFNGKVPLYFRYLSVGICLWDNKFTEMDWRYFTEDIGYVPELKDNCLTGTVPEEVLSTERWKYWKHNLEPQRRGSGLVY